MSRAIGRQQSQTRWTEGAGHDKIDGEGRRNCSHGGDEGPERTPDHVVSDGTTVTTVTTGIVGCS